MQRKFLTYCLLFFIPIALVYGILEYFTLAVPSAHQIKETRIEKYSDTIETLVFGSSQSLCAINPEFIESPTLSLASGDQHHDTDFKLLKQLRKQFPKLKNVVFEVSYSHFELPHNGKDFWKNSIYLKYYDVSAFERNTYFKDQWIFHSNPPLFSKLLNKYYIHNERPFNFNEHGFNKADTYGQFAKRDYDEDQIQNMRSFKINLEPSKQLFQINTQLFTDMLEYCQQENLNVILLTVPMYKTYLQKRNPEILKRRDSVLQIALEKYTNVLLFHRENDTTNYEVKDFYNQSHQSHSGAKKTSTYLNTFLKENL